MGVYTKDGIEFPLGQYPDDITDGFAEISGSEILISDNALERCGATLRGGGEDDVPNSATIVIKYEA